LLGPSDAFAIVTATPYTGHVYGKITDGKTLTGLGYVAVSILAADKDSLISGMLTDDNGSFSFSNLPNGNFRLKATYEGYAPLIKKISLTPAASELNLNSVSISPSEHKMNEVTITADKAASTLGVDKKVFNVDKDISSRGGNALDVMQNLPGVAVDADGNVTLRNNSPLIYVDGKPTTLTLDQIPSDQIDYVEVITNPSAKYEAAASGGIINVVMKHNTKPGYNGLITALAGTNDQYNGSAMVNVHKGIIGASLSANVNGATNTTNGYDNRINLNNNNAPSSYFNQGQQKTNERRYENIRAGLDFYLDKRNTLSITQTVVFGWFDNIINSNQSSYDSTKTETSTGKNYNLEAVTRRNYTTMLDFRHTYPKRGKEYNITLQYDRQTSVTSFIDTTNSYDLNGNLLSNKIFKQNIPSGVESHMVTAQWDFTHPMRDSIKLEYGVRGYYKRTNSYANTSSYSDSLSSFVSDAPLSSDFLTQETIDAAYFTISQHIKRFSYQIGVRYEEDYFIGQLINTGQSFSYHYPQSNATFYEGFFPSFYLSQGVNDHNLFQLNVTRKTNRPSPGQINPNLEVIDQQDYTKGNADLQPEFINQGEVNYNLTYSVVDWLSSVYARYTEHPIVGITVDSTLNNTPNVLLATYANGKGKFNYGWENTFKFFPVKNLTITADVNVFYTNIQAYLPEGTRTVLLTNSGYSYTAKGIISYKFPMGFAAQINGSYEAPKPVPQGSTLPVYYFDVAASKELGPLTINFGISDVLNSNTHGYNYDVPDEYIQSLSKRRQTRYAKLGLSFKFGKDDKVTKKRKKDKEGPKEDDSE
jgi:outer membrane receptor protein involved in Fe transport